MAWGITAAVYTGTAVLHLLVTMRPGYCVSVSHALGLPAVFRASSRRTDPVSWVAGDLSVPLKEWIPQVLPLGNDITLMRPHVSIQQQ